MASGSTRSPNITRRRRSIRPISRSAPTGRRSRACPRTCADQIMSVGGLAGAKFWGKKLLRHRRAGRAREGQGRQTTPSSVYAVPAGRARPLAQARRRADLGRMGEADGGQGPQGSPRHPQCDPRASEELRRSDSVMPRASGAIQYLVPVRFGFLVQSKRRCYWIARFSRAMTAEETSHARGDGFAKRSANGWNAASSGSSYAGVVRDLPHDVASRRAMPSAAICSIALSSAPTRSPRKYLMVAAIFSRAVLRLPRRRLHPRDLPGRSVCRAGFKFVADYVAQAISLFICLRPCCWRRPSRRSVRCPTTRP